MTYTNCGLLITFSFESLFQLAERGDASAIEFADPAIRNFVDRHRVEVVQLLAASPDGGDEVRALENREVLRHSLARHVEVRAEIRQRLPVLFVQAIQQRAAAGIRERSEGAIEVVDPGAIHHPGS